MRIVMTVLLLSLGLAGQAHAFLKVCNKSGEKVYVAVGYHEGEDWIAEGWWPIEAQDCANVVNGDLTKKFYYIRAEGVNGRIWSGDYFFCTTDDRFLLTDNPSCVSSDVDREGFFELDTGDSVDFTSNLTTQ